MKLTCMIVDDEPLARDVLVQYAVDCPSLEVVKLCQDAFEAGDYLQDHSVDLIFLDINMPRLSGLRFINTLTRPVMIIFTTAYPEYAAEGFDSNAIDYLVKPFSFERFMKGVNKALEWAHARAGKSHPSAGPGHLPEFILLRADKKIYKLNYNELLFFEATGDYIKVHTTERKLVIHETFKNLADQLPEEQFIRVHKSYIVSLDRIRLLEGNELEVAGHRIPIGLVYREGLMTRLNIRSRKG